MRIKPLVTACLLGGLSIASSVQAENLMEVYRLAINNDPKFLSAGAQLEANLEQSNQSLSSLLPSLSASYGIDYSKRGSDDGAGFYSRSENMSTSAGLSLRQSIYDYSTWVGYDQANKRVEQAKVRYKANQQDLIVRVAGAYFDVLDAKDTLTFREAERVAILQELEQTKERFEVGLIAFTDVHEAQARFDQSEADRIAAQNALDNAIEALREITGQYHENVDVLKSSIPLLTPKPAKIDDWVQVAKQSNLDVIAANMDVYIANQETKRRFGGHLPSVDLTANYSDTISDPSGSDLEPESYGLTAGISVSIPLYSGGNTQSRVNEGDALYQKATYDLEGAVRSSIRTTRSSYLGIEASIAGIKALEQAVVSSQSALEATQVGFEVGTRTIVDVLSSTRLLYSARSNLASAKYRYINNILRLKQAAGILTQDDLVEINNWLTAPTEAEPSSN
jgi:outer membrane protein